MAELSPHSERLQQTLDARVHDLGQRFEQITQSMAGNPSSDSLPIPFLRTSSQPKLSRQQSFEMHGLNDSMNSIKPTLLLKSKWLPLKQNIRTLIDIARATETNDVVSTPDIAKYTQEDIEMQGYWKTFQIPSASSPEDIKLEGLSIQSDTEEFKEEFDKEAEDIRLSVSKIPASIVLENKARLEKALLDERRRTDEYLKDKEADLLFRENLAANNLIAEEKKLRERIKMEKLALIDTTIQSKRDIDREFKRAREELEIHLQKQKARIQDSFGQITFSETTLGRNLQAAYIGIPQPIEIRIHFLRAVKSKLPKGAYVFVISQYESLGGKPLWWNKVGPYGISKKMPGVTKPVKHYGRYFDRIMRFEDSVFTLCPPRSMLRPSFCLVLEIFQLKSKLNPYDKCVGWTALPMCNEHHGHVQGNLKLPILRGEHSPNCQHFRKMESAMIKDLNNWLCNMYLEIRHLPLETLEDQVLAPAAINLDYINHSISSDVYSILRQKSFYEPIIKTDKEDQTKSKEFSSPLAVDKGLYRRNRLSKSPNIEEQATNQYLTKESNFENKNEIANVVPMSPSKQKPKGNMTLPIIWDRVSRYFRKAKIADITSSNSKLYEEEVEDVEAGVRRIRTDGNNVHGSSESHMQNIDLANNSNLANDSTTDYNPIEIYERGYNSDEDFYLHDEQRGKIAGIETISNENGRKWAVAALEGPVIRRYQSDGPRLDAEAIPVSHEKNLIGSDNKTRPPTNYMWKKLEDFRDVETFTMSIASDPSQRKRLLPKVIQKNKLRFLGQELFGEFSRYKIGSFTFYLNIFIFITALWLRVYVHYLAEYLYLTIIGTPVYSFIPYVTEISFKYMSSSISVASEVGLVSIGPIATLVAFVVMGILGKLFYQVAGFMLDSVSNFIAFFGLVSAIDPVLIILVDLFNTNYACGSMHATCRDTYTKSTCHCFEGDFIKLWNRFLIDEGSGVSGAIITVIIYIGVMTCSFLLLYEYLVYVHRDARILDLWRRINAPSEEFFLPDDYEVSAEELTSICAMAQRWKGIDGSRRKLHISTFTEQLTGSSSQQSAYESIKHYAVYNYDAKGNRRTIHRHFIVIEDGTILEIFEQFHHIGTRSEAYAADTKCKRALDAMLEEEDNHLKKKNILIPKEINSQKDSVSVDYGQGSTMLVSLDAHGAHEIANIFAGIEKA